MDNNKDTDKVETNVETPINKETTKTYTKEDLDNSFNAGVKKANSDWQKDEKYKEFLEWKKTSQSESEKISELQTSNNELTKENQTLKALIKVNESNVKKEFSEFVTDKVMKAINENDDFETALKKFKADNPQYFGETVVKKVQTSPVLQNGDNKSNTTNNIMNSILRGAR